VTPEDLRFRFLSSVAKVDHAQIAAMTEVDYRRTISFLAIDPAGSVVATAMLAADSDLERAEIAMSTRSDMKRKGVSYLLLEHVLRYAEAQGIAFVEAVEFADHEEALRMERELGFTAVPCPDDPHLRIVRRAFAEPRAC
jgi:acetyltransferase